MATKWMTIIKPAFWTQLLGLSPKEAYQVQVKVELVVQNPLPDGNVKKQIRRKYKGHTVYRIRSGDFRIRYYFKQSCVILLDVLRRNEHNYDEDIDDETFNFPEDEDIFSEEENSKVLQPDWEKWLSPNAPEKKRLPYPLTEELLTNLHIPQQYHRHLSLIQIEDDLLECSGVPNELMNRVIEYLFPRPLEQILEQPDYILNQADDLLRFKEGELLSFLLKLSPEQEKFVNWAIKASGPTQVKGGPGTGKSTVALYRVRSLIEKLCSVGQTEPRILFTTYTNALVKSSEQLLKQLLGEDACFVEVQTADKKVSDILKRFGVPLKTPREDGTIRRIFRQALVQTEFDGNMQQQQAQKQSLERLDHDDYLQDEITKVIIARKIASLQDYMIAKRPGRKVRLSELQKKAIWNVYGTFLKLLRKENLETWQQARLRAESLVSKDCEFQSYDAVVVDEAQDLDPAMIRILIGLGKSPNRFFITADANQSIYGSGFTWTDVHESLKFQGRTSVLRANYRSTREIGEATQAYLSTGLLDIEPVERVYVNNGPLPAIRSVKNERVQAQLLARFLPRAAREFRFGLGACAVLCPTEKAGEAIAVALKEQGVNAAFMKGQNLNLSLSCVKVITLNSSKGLEFPVVALAGFFGSYQYANIDSDTLDEGQEEDLARRRRTIFVGMTRAMRALLVIVPEGTRSPLLTGFDPAYWNIG